jgi:hypothetical protein
MMAMLAAVAKRSRGTAGQWRFAVLLAGESVPIRSSYEFDLSWCPQAPDSSVYGPVNLPTVTGTTWTRVDGQGFRQGLARACDRYIRRNAMELMKPCMITAGHTEPVCS